MTTIARLVRAVITFQTEAVLGAQEPLLSRLDSMEGLRTWRDCLVQLQQERQCQGGCPIGSLGSELADSDDQARNDIAAGFSRWEGSIREGPHAMHDRGELRHDADPDQLGLAVLTALQGGLLLTQIRRDTVALEAGLDVVLDRIGMLIT